MSLSLDLTSMLDQAFTLVNSLWPVFVIPVGFAVGLGLLSKILGEIRKAF